MTIGLSTTMVRARRLRESIGVTQDQMGREAGFSHLSIHRWETGKNHPSIHAVETYLQAIGYQLAIVPIEDSRVKEVAS